MARRIVFALLVTVLASYMYLNVLGFMFLALCSLGYACYEHQWEHWLIDQHHIVNEIFIYALSVMLFVFGGFLGAFTASLGWVFISIFCCFTVYNSAMVLRFALRTIYKIGKTFYVKQIKKRFSSRESKVADVGDIHSEPKEKYIISEELRIKPQEMGTQTDDPNGFFSKMWDMIQTCFGRRQDLNRFFAENDDQVSFG